MVWDCPSVYTFSKEVTGGLMGRNILLIIDDSVGQLKWTMVTTFAGNYDVASLYFYSRHNSGANIVIFTQQRLFYSYSY